jgi:hypothetical protein
MDSGGGGDVGEVPQVLADNGLDAGETRWFMSMYSTRYSSYRASGYDRVQAGKGVSADLVADHVDPADSNGVADTPTFSSAAAANTAPTTATPHRGGQDGKGSAEASTCRSVAIRSTTSRLTPRFCLLGALSGVPQADPSADTEYGSE